MLALQQARALGAAFTTRLFEAASAASNGHPRPWRAAEHPSSHVATSLQAFSAAGGEKKGRLDCGQLLECLERLNARKPREWAAQTLLSSMLETRQSEATHSRVRAGGARTGSVSAPEGIAFNQLLGAVSKEILAGPVEARPAPPHAAWSAPRRAQRAWPCACADGVCPRVLASTFL